MSLPLPPRGESPTEPAFPTPLIHQDLRPITAVCPALQELPADPAMPGTLGQASHPGAPRQGAMKLPRYNREGPPETYLIKVQLMAQSNARSAEETRVLAKFSSRSSRCLCERSKHIAAQIEPCTILQPVSTASGAWKGLV